MRLIARYHSNINNPYPFPNDEPEQERLDRLHSLMKNLFGGNILAPLHTNPSFILDLGTGSGVIIIF